MTTFHRNHEHSQSMESSFSQSMSNNHECNLNEPSSSASFLADNRGILREMKPTTMKLIASDQENSVSQKQLNPQYPHGRFIRTNSDDHIDKFDKIDKMDNIDYYSHYKEHSITKSKTKGKLKSINGKSCCGYLESKSEDDNYHNKRRPKQNIKVIKYSDDDQDDSYQNVNNDIIAGLQKSRRSKSISNSNGANESKEALEHLEKYRKLNGVIFGKLTKFPGDSNDNIKFKKVKEKFVVYVPQKQLLFYAKNKDPNDQTTIISVKKIEINDIKITRQLKKKYRDKYFKVIGHTRMVLFAASTHQHAQTWYKVIRNSLSINMKLIESRLTLNDQYYIDGWLGKFRGDSNDNIKFKKKPKAKYVIFIPQMKILFFCGEQKNKVKVTLVHIRKITRKNKYISRNFEQYHTEYQNSWFKIIGEKRIVVFVAKSMDERDVWFNQILKALYPSRDNHKE